MNIYVLKRLDFIRYDEYIGKVIVAVNAKNAREMANVVTGDEGPIWIDPTKVSCDRVQQNDASIVLTSFKAG